MTSSCADKPCRTKREGRALRLIARAEKLLRLAKIGKVDALLERAATLASGFPTALLRIVSMRIGLERQRGDYERALLFAKQALKASRSTGDVATELRVRVEIGRTLLSVGNSAEALREGIAVLGHVDAIVDDGKRRGVTVEAWRLLAYVYLNLEQFEQAIDFCERAIDGARIDGNLVLEGAAVDCMACAYGTMAYHRTAEGRHAEAVDLLERSLAHSRRAMALARQAGHRHNEATALANVAEGLVQSGRPEEALALMQTWQMDPIEDLPLIGSHHFDTHGSICMSLGRNDEAIVLFTRALEAAMQSNLALVACEHLADAYERAGDLEAALRHYKRFHALFKEAASKAAQRSASTAAIYLETRDAVSRAHHHRGVAERLKHSNEQLLRHTDELTALSRHDPLTGLPNRRVLEQFLADDHASLGIVMIDVDRFKVINDGWSHLVGDAVLRQVALLIRSCCRDIDTPVRYGGDEFAVLLRHADEHRTSTVAERIREMIQSFDWNSLAPHLVVSVSVGFSVGSGSDAATSVLAVADRRLHDAKQGGRNRVRGSVANGMSAADAAIEGAL